MRLYIIGNGFDIAHNLPTKYWDFRTYLKNQYPGFLEAFEQHYQISPNDSDEYKKDLLWNEFETNLANIDEDVIIENAVGIEMGLESGDIGIEDTLRYYFRSEYNYVNMLATYLKQWVQTINISNTPPITSKIGNFSSNDFFINFNYTSVLENVYQVNPSNILHIHGSLRKFDDDPILGHGNTSRIEDIKSRRNHAQICRDEKLVSICTVIEEYYSTTLKNVRNYMYKLNSLYKFTPEEIIVIGHSISGIDLPYFKLIDELTRKTSFWKIYYFEEIKKANMRKALETQGISWKRIQMEKCAKFYDLSNINI